MCPLSLVGNYMDLIGDQSAEVAAEFLLSTEAKRREIFFQNFACRAAGRPTSGHIAKQSIVYNQLGAIPLWPSGAVNGHEL